MPHHTQPTTDISIPLVELLEILWEKECLSFHGKGTDIYSIYYTQPVDIQLFKKYILSILNTPKVLFEDRGDHIYKKGWPPTIFGPGTRYL